MTLTFSLACPDCGERHEIPYQVSGRYVRGTHMNPPENPDFQIEDGAIRCMDCGADVREWYSERDLMELADEDYRGWLSEGSAA